MRADILWVRVVDLGVIPKFQYWWRRILHNVLGPGAAWLFRRHLLSEIALGELPESRCLALH